METCITFIDEPLKKSFKHPELGEVGFQYIIADSVLGHTQCHIQLRAWKISNYLVFVKSSVEYAGYPMRVRKIVSIDGFLNSCIHDYIPIYIGTKAFPGRFILWDNKEFTEPFKVKVPMDIMTYDGKNIYQIINTNFDDNFLDSLYDNEFIEQAI